MPTISADAVRENELCKNITNKDLADNIESLEKGVGHTLIVQDQPYEIVSISGGNALNGVSLKDWIIRKDNSDFGVMNKRMNGNICEYHAHPAAIAVGGPGQVRSVASITFNLHLKPLVKSLRQLSLEKVKSFQNQGDYQAKLNKLPKDLQEELNKQ
jgi:hypothetical protein